MSTDPAVLWIAGIAAFLFVAIVMPLAARAWRALGRADSEVSLRKVHTGEIPRVGGFVLMLGFGLVLITGLSGTHQLSATHELFSISPITGALLGALLCGLVGLYDDLVGMRARYKLLVQIAAAVLAVAFGVHWDALHDLIVYFGMTGPFGAALCVGITIAFLIAAVNAINLMDGLDGLAGGICAIGHAVVVLAAIHHGATEVAVGWISATALGAVVGFLVHNRHPARVFMGDTGSYFLGFLMPALLLFVYPVRLRVSIITFSIPLMVMALPLFDMTLAIARRYVRGQPIFSGDCDHIHHRLLARGVSHGRVVLLLWGLTGMFATLAYLNVIGVGGWWTLGGTIVAMLVTFVALGYHNILRTLPAFAGQDLLGMRDRRRQMMELLAAIERLSSEPAPADERDTDRWRRLTPELAPILGRLGVPEFEVRRGSAVLSRAGDGRNAWAWLSLPIPGSGGAELRLSLAVRLPELRQEQLVLIERVVSLLAGKPLAARQSQSKTAGSAPEHAAAASSSGVHAAALGDAGGRT